MSLQARKKKANTYLHRDTGILETAVSISLVTSLSLSLFIAIFQEFSLSSVPVHVCSSIYGSTWYQPITTKPRSTRTTGVPGDHRPLCRLKTSISGSRNSNGRVCVTNLGTKFFGVWMGMVLPCVRLYSIELQPQRGPRSRLDQLKFLCPGSPTQLCLVFGCFQPYQGWGFDSLMSDCVKTRTVSQWLEIVRYLWATAR